MRLGVDCSNFTGDLSGEQVAALKDAGVSFAIVGTQKFTTALQQIEALERGGIEVPAAYCFLYWDGNDTHRIQLSLDLGKPLWLDCEYKTGLDVQSVRERIHAAVNQCGAQCAGIYTGSWWWQPKTANYDGFKDLPLWHAAYQPQPDSLDLSHPYGGWTKAQVWQWSSDGLAGINVDLNVMEEVPAPVLIDGIGVRADDDATLDLWPEIVVWLGGRELKAVGAHFDDGHEETLWPK